MKIDDLRNMIISKKKHIYCLLFLIFSGFFVSSCSSDDETCDIPQGIIGEWRLVSWTENAPDGFEVYVEFTSSSKFELYQRVETSDYTKYTGRYSTACNSRLTGVYDDGESWGSEYDFEVTDNGNTLTMTTVAEPVETSIYSRTIIPDDVRNVRSFISGQLNVKSVIFSQQNIDTDNAADIRDRTETRRIL